jgi:type VI secretion system protein ImpB
MPVIDIESLLNEISPDNQAGEDMEYDPAFIELMEAVEGSPGQQVGDTFVEGVEPDWKKAQSIATELFSRTKDIRVGVYLVQALINTHAYAGLADGVLLLERLVSRYWDTLHPQLDPDDDNDPTMRINVIATLADFDATINPIRMVPLVSSKMMGQFSLRDTDIANGMISLPDDYDGAEKKVQIPFVMGVMADLSGKPEEPLPVVAERKFLEIDVDNFDDRMKAMKPRVAFPVDNVLTGEGQMSVDLTFESMDDFSPAAVARKVDSLNQLLQARTQLANLVTYMDGKVGAEELIEGALTDKALLQSLVAAPKPEDDAEEAAKEEG